MADMKKETQKYKERKANAKQSFRFINHRLSAADVEALEATDLESEYPLSLIGEAVSSGYKVSFSPDERNNCVVASLTDKADTSVFCNACLTGRGATTTDAWYALAYRHFTLAQGDWAALGTGENENRSRFS